MNSTHPSTMQPMTLSSDTRMINIAVLMLFILTAGCAHYPINDSLESLTSKIERRNRSANAPGTSEKLHVILTFSGGGTRAAAFSYGVLEELVRTELSIDGKKRRLLDEVDAISGVSGGSFTAAYYGLYGDRTFEGGVFADINARRGPHIIINATDMTYGGWFTFTPNIFDVICSDLASMRVAQAAAASSAVPGIDLSWDLRERPPSSLEALGSFSSVAISRYNYETLNLLRRNFKQWAEEIQNNQVNILTHSITA